jgi:hypothetical protein
LRIHRHADVQEQATLFVAANDRRVLKYQNMVAARTAISHMSTGGCEYLLNRHGIIMEKSVQTDFSGSAAAQPAQGNALGAQTSSLSQKPGPLFSRRKSPKWPSDSNIEPSKEAHHAQLYLIQSHLSR